MIPIREGVASPLDFELVSPELALVDPSLAEAARATLPDVVPSPRRELRPEPRAPDALIALANAALDDAPEERPARARRFRSRLAMATTMLGAAAVLLLLDVRVDVGKTPASAVSPIVDESLLTRPPAQTDTGVPATQGGGAPAAGPVVPRVRQFAWAPVPHASSYHVEFFRGPERVFVADTKRPGVTVPARWSLDGRSRSLAPGEYRWYVWPVVSGRRASQAIVRAELTVSVS